jgi:cystathionine beta-synthase
MKDHGFMENREFGTAKDIIQSRGSNSKITTVDKDTTVQEVISIMAKEGISQIPVTDGEHYIGSLNESKVLYQLLDNPEIKKQPVKEIMEKPFKFVGMDYTIDALSSLIDKDNKAVLVRDEKNEVHIITQADLLAALAK